MKAQMFQNVPTSISLAIWGTAFMQGRETLERAVDCISDAPRTVSTVLNQESLAIFLSNCRKSGTTALRCHFPRTGNMDFIIGNDEFVDVVIDKPRTNIKIIKDTCKKGIRKLSSFHTESLH
jgi:hypothetical protein